jgi:hypothetical protein
MPLLTPKIAEKAVVEDDNGNRKYDYDAIAWGLHDKD